MSQLQLIYMLGIILIQYACVPKENNKHNEPKIVKVDTCKSIISTFNYPTHIDSLDRLKYICNYSVLVDIAYIKKIRLTTRFDDKDYTLLTYDYKTKIFVDKSAGLILCFKCYSGIYSFTRESIMVIYILDADLMPLYSIGAFTFSKETILEKFYHDGENPVSYIINLKKGIKPILKSLTYGDIVELAKSLKNGDYTITNQNGHCIQDPYFKTTPFWTEL